MNPLLSTPRGTSSSSSSAAFDPSGNVSLGLLIPFLKAATDTLGDSASCESRVRTEADEAGREIAGRIGGGRSHLSAEDPSCTAIGLVTTGESTMIALESRAIASDIPDTCRNDFN